MDRVIGFVRELRYLRLVQSFTTHIVGNSHPEQVVRALMITNGRHT